MDVTSQGRSQKRPSFQYYPADWRKDAGLQSCSLAARGLWHEMICIAHECEPYGHLTVAGKAMTKAQIARLVGLSERECSKLLGELEGAGVPSVAENGAYFSRRMVRDEDLRQRRAEGGKGGAEYGFRGAEHGSKGGRPKKETGDKKPPSKPSPSSSPSSSSSEDSPLPPLADQQEVKPLCTIEQAMQKGIEYRLSTNAIRYWWNDRNSKGWRKGGLGSPRITSWQSDLANAQWAEEAAAKARQSNGGSAASKAKL